MAKKKNNKSDRSRAAGKSAKLGNGKLKDGPSIGRFISAKDAGWRSPTFLVLPMTMVPVDPPEPSERKKRKADHGEEESE